MHTACIMHTLFKSVSDLNNGKLQLLQSAVKKFPLHNISFDVTVWKNLDTRISNINLKVLLTKLLEIFEIRLMCFNLWRHVVGHRDTNSWLHLNEISVSSEIFVNSSHHWKPPYTKNTPVFKVSIPFWYPSCSDIHPVLISSRFYHCVSSQSLHKNHLLNVTFYYKECEIQYALFLISHESFPYHFVPCIEMNFRPLRGKERHERWEAHSSTIARHKDAVCWQRATSV
jgi:hypothetical protein